MKTIQASTQPKSKVVDNIVRYSSSRIFQRFCGVVNLYIKPKLLSPELYGLWNFFSLIWTYASYSQLGSREAMHYMIPQNEGEGLHEQNQEIVQSAFWITFALSCLLAFAVLVYALVKSHDTIVRLGLVVLSVLIMLYWYRDFYFSYLRAYQRFSLLGSAIYLRAFTAMVLNLALIYFLGIYGVYIAALLTAFITIGFLRKYAPLSFQFKISLKIFKKLVVNGLPIMFYNAVHQFILTTDQLVISWRLGTEALGYYAIAGMVVTFVAQIPSGARDVIEPMLMQDLDSQELETNLVKFFYKPILITSYLLPLIIGSVYFALPVVISLILPRYQDSVYPTQILSIGSFFIITSFTTRGMIVAKGKQMKASLLICGIIPLSIGLNYYMIQAGYGLPGVAFGSGICYFILNLILLLVVRNLYLLPYSKLAGLFGLILLPFSIMFIAIYGLSTFPVQLTTHFIVEASIKIVIICSIHGLLYLLIRRILISRYSSVR